MKTLICGLVLMLFAGSLSGDPPGNELTDIERLLARAPKEPAVLVGREDMDLMYRVAQTKQVRAVGALIECLGWNLDPDQRGEILGPCQMIYAASMIEASFDESILPLLFCAAVETEKPWLEERLTVAIQCIGSKERIEHWIKILHLETHEATLVGNLRQSGFTPEYAHQVPEKLHRNPK